MNPQTNSPILVIKSYIDENIYAVISVVWAYDPFCKSDMNFDC